MMQKTSALEEYDRKSPSFLQTDRDYYWGYVYFRQVKDKSLPRGYFQKVRIAIKVITVIRLNSVTNRKIAFSECCYNYETAVRQSVWWIVRFNCAGIFRGRNGTHGGCGARDRSVAPSSSRADSSFTSHRCVIPGKTYAINYKTALIFTYRHCIYYTASNCYRHTSQTKIVKPLFPQ